MGLHRDKTIYRLTMTAAAAAALCVLSPWAVPLGPVPISLCTLLIYLSAWLLSPGGVVTAVAVYVLIGTAGLPVFSGFVGGLGRLVGPTGGYIVGYLPLAAISACCARRFSERRGMQLLGLVLGTAVLYAVGTGWFCAQMQVGLVGGLTACVLPFLPGDAVKIVAALLLGPVLRGRLVRSGLLYE